MLNVKTNFDQINVNVTSIEEKNLDKKDQQQEAK